MRYGLVAFALFVLLGVGALGFRGAVKRQAPLQVFRDMKQQAKSRPQGATTFFGDGRSSRPWVAGTVPRARPLELDGRQVYPFEDAPVNTGRLRERTNFVGNIPLPVTQSLRVRGAQRYAVHCLPCHGPEADGRSPSSRLGVAVVANLQDQRIRSMADGEVFDTITRGKNLMSAYGSLIDLGDRWAILAHVRSLQQSHPARANPPPANRRPEPASQP
jgi:hypothetical protein